jgi:hypothetical protein
MVWARALVISSVALVAAGCGGSGPSARHASSTANPRELPQIPEAIPTPDPSHHAARASAVAVIRGWSTALRAGQLEAAARYFQLPSELINGVGSGGELALIRIRTLQQAEAANETLPCGAKFISADQRGQYVNALFRLTGRRGPGGSSCGSGQAGTARTNFVISGGHIVEWIRAPDDPRDHQTPEPSGPQFPGPGAPQPPGPGGQQPPGPGGPSV